jgi:nucleoside-diphosphate-sugar epimerase
VADLIEGVLAAARIDAFDSPVNLGNPGELTMLELAEATMRVAGKRVDLVRKPLPKDDPRRRCPDITKARRLLGFEPKTPLEFGLQKTYEDFRARLAPASRP